MTPVSTRWTGEQNKRFEQALALFCCSADEDIADDGADARSSKRWQKIAARVPGKSPTEVQRHYDILLEDVAAIEAGKVAMPDYQQASYAAFPTPSERQQRLVLPPPSNYKPGGGGVVPGMYAAAGASACRAKASEQERKKGIPWTKEEHRLFLLGLEEFGKGDWRSISRNFVVSRTPTQVASHAQKYFIRLNSMHKEKRRASIHDITNAAAAPASSSPPSTPCPPPPPPSSLPPLHPGGAFLTPPPYHQ